MPCPICGARTSGKCDRCEMEERHRLEYAENEQRQQYEWSNRDGELEADDE